MAEAAAPRPAISQLRLVAWSGVLLGVVLAVAMAYVVAKDHRGRIDAAQRQALVLADGSARQVRLELRNLERALLGLAEDSVPLLRQAGTEGALSAATAALVARNSELDSVEVVDASGAALTAGRGDPALPRWAVASSHGPDSQLHIGPLQRSSAGGWVLALAVPMGERHWVLARLSNDELQTIVSRPDVGRGGVISLYTADGTIVMRSARVAELVGSRVPLPAPQARSGERVEMGAYRNSSDGVVRIAATAVLRGYPLRVYAGLARDDVLAPWWPFVAAAVLVYALYWGGLAYLLHTLRRSGRQQRRLLEDLRAGDEDLRLAHQAGGIGTWWVGVDGREVHWSPQARQILHAEAASMDMAAFLELVHSDDRSRARHAVRAAWEDNQPLDITGRVLLPGQGERWIAVRGARVPDHGRRRMTGTLVDVSERVQVQMQALDAQRQFRLIFELNPLPCWLFALDTLRFIEVNPAAERQYGYSREEFLALRITDIRPPEYVDDIVRRLRTPDAVEGGTSMTTVHRCRDGRLIEVRVHSSAMEIAGVKARLVLAENISQYMASQRELAYRASHDLATGLLTVAALAEQTDRRHPAGYTIVHVQLRGLQLIGDTLGRATGDDVLRGLCSQLRGLFGERHGGLAFQPAEDFVLAIDDGHDADGMVDALVTLLSGPVRGHDSLHQLDAHIGVARFPRDGGSAAEVIGNAAQAAHAAREAGTALLRFERAIAVRLADRLRLIGRLHEAISRDEFELHYQPIVNAADGRPAALEALIRWRSPEQGLVAPGQFIQLCEDTGLILPLGRWAIRQAARDSRRLADSGWPTLPIAINVSAMQFRNTDLVADVQAASAAFGLDEGALHIELTESSLMHDPEHALEIMHRLHAQGVCVSLDDFGTGFSSMAYLQHMPLDSLKIDKVFVDDVDSNPRNASICLALLTLGHNLGLKVIAEGVERPAQHDWLTEHGCDQLQGYLIARPATLAQFLESRYASVGS